MAGARFKPGAVAILAVMACLAGTAQGQCRPSAGASRLDIQGFGTAYFQQFSTDTAKGRADLYGGVCLVGAGHGWTLAAQALSVSGLRQGSLEVRAAHVTATVQGWTVSADALQGDRQRLRLTSVTLSDHGVGGTAAAADVDLASGAIRVRGLDLHGAAFYLRGSAATLASDRLAVTAPRVTSCNCAGPPLYQVSGASATVTLQGQRIVLVGGQLEVAGLKVPLASSVTLDAQTLKSLTLPLTVAYVAGDAASGTPGTGLEVLLTHLGLAPGVSAKLGATGLDADHPLAGVALLQGTGDGASFVFGKAPGGLRFEERSDRAVTPWFDAGFDTRVLEPGNRDTLREAVLHGRLHTGVPALNGTAALSLFAAASSQQPAAGEVAGARTGAEASLTASTPAAAPWGRLSVRLAGRVSAYPDQHASQWGVDVRPGYALNAGPVALKLGYLARFTDSGSPFTTSLDRLEPVQRPSGSVTVAGALAPDWRGSAKLSAQYDLVGSSGTAQGLNRLDASAALTRTVGSWSVTLSGDAVLAGVLAPNGKRDGYLQAGLTATHADLALGSRVRYRFAPAATGLELLQVSAAVPLDLPGVVVRPYLALDFAPTLAAGALPAISGHGLDLTVPTCCGVLKLGYRDDEGTWTVSVAVDLSAGAAQAAGGGACPSAAPSDAAIAAASAPPVCGPAGGGAGAGIMGGAASGPPS